MTSARMYSLGFCVLVVLSLLILPISARTKKMQRIATGTWGGQHIQIDVDEKSATVSFDCAHGFIEGPFTIDDKGHFSWKGTYSREHGGPVRIDENDTGEAVIYSGLIKGQTMNLSVRLENQKELLDTFVLTHGKAGRIRKCL